MLSALRSAALFAIVSALAALSLPGCSQQGQGERCDSVKNGDDDCDSGLTCVGSGELLDKVTDRCCPAEGIETDSRCKRSSATGSGGSSAGGSAGTTAGGSSSEPGGAGAGTETGGTTSTDGGTSNQSNAGSPATDEASAGVGGAG
ncbi:MAG TPA: hypothetical protein VEQ59_13440 [Polyangiaceae bacterium]|nr:hypothetical protein [Polyangiaceae bacterium]